MTILSPAAQRQPRQPTLVRAAGALSPPAACLLIGLAGVTLLTFLTPPFEVADELQHFFRSYQLSELQIWGSVRNGAGGAVLPASLSTLAAHFLGTSAIWAVRTIAPQPLADTLAQLHLPLDPAQRQFTDFTGAVFYSPLAYIPQSLGVLAGRLVGAPPLALFYLGRLANGIAAVGAVAYALKKLPFGKGAALAAGLLPMAQFEYASLSADTSVIAAAFVFTAVALRAVAEGRWRQSEVAICAVSGAIFCSAKPVYAPLLLIGLGALFRRDAAEGPAVGGVLRVHLVVAGIPLAVTGLWFLSTSSSMIAFHRFGNPDAQISYIFHNPLRYCGTLVLTPLVNLGTYLRSGIGILADAWFVVALPAVAYLLVGVISVLSLFTDSVPSGSDRPSAAAWNFLLAASGFLLVETAAYLGWNGVGAMLIGSIQGRYFLPLLALVGATVTGRHRLAATPTVAAAAYVALAAAVAVNTAMALLAVSDAYHVF